MLSARAPDGDRELLLSLRDIAGHDAIEEGFPVLEELLGVAVVEDVVPHLLVEAGHRPHLGVVEGIWQEADVYDEMYALGLQLLALLMKDAREGHTRELEAWDWSRTSYMKRYGGQNTRGWEFVLTFKEDFGLVR